MGKIKYPKPVKLIAGFIFAQEKIFFQAKEELVKKFGEIDFESPLFSFNYTDYYRKEMGNKLWRKFVSFKRLFDPEKIVSVKLFTNEIEQKFSSGKKRKVNIDPGYLTLSKLVLTTTKNFAHRIYLGKGIYAEVTLRYIKGKGFQPWEWTYPDYRSEDYLEVFNSLREKYKKQLEKEEKGEDGKEGV